MKLFLKTQVVGIIFLMTSTGVFFMGCASNKGLVLYSPPSALPNVTTSMKTAGFWIGRHENPDQVILSPEKIKQFNQQIIDKKLNTDLSVWSSQIKGDTVKTAIQKIADDLKVRDLMHLDGQKMAESFWNDVNAQMNLEAIAPSVKRQYGLITHYVDQRLLPTAEGLYATAGDVDFDELQNSAFDMGTPVVIFHESKNGEWVYVESVASAGWILKDMVKTVSDEELTEWFLSPFVVVTDSKADVFLDENLTDYYGYVQMGTRLPIKNHLNDKVQVMLPTGIGYIKTTQITEGFLSYTPRHLLEQAFKMLHEPYGWGGMYGEQDCSRFMQQIFATVGINLPRNSKEQQKAGELLTEWNSETSDPEKKKYLTEHASGGITLLGLKGHIMLYLGSVDGNPYAIHEVWAYRQPNEEGDDIFVLNRVTVSDLSLGEGSKKGSLAKRTINVSIVK